MTIPTEPLTRLQTFRANAYACLRRRQDALFELGDALLSAGPVSSPVHLSLEPHHRRGWGSLYAALADGDLDTDALRGVLAEQIPPDDPPISPLMSASGRGAMRRPARTEAITTTPLGTRPGSRLSPAGRISGWRM
jgi:hypothetical protein